ncbi:rhomboid family intramembrane serine protease [Luteibacter anthropi]|uniref:Rhomboid family intramembrane serine protease n=1 Tax=Luteibacter anthropi TaxID=564369 RepID=A0A7X5ZHD7_9GAMM|nr:rhomboid family intramembrane serine protease [Luteibacter anthropi]NII05763.1 rhomboid family intramembrane serine protease [Luteibacter anthropi]URX61976.1 rhomboid family intramembrane serine protease [Luteibacter anthropi]
MITLLIILVTCVVSIIAFRNQRLMDDLILWPPALSRSREYYRLVSYGLVHADGGHLFFNMFSLYFAGRIMEGFFTAAMGPLGFLTFYIGALVFSILPSYLANRRNAGYRSLGASGAVSAILFAFIMLSPWSKIYLIVIPMPAILYAILFVVYSVYMDKRGGDNVNHSAHLWGALYGVLFTVAMNPAVLPRFLSLISQPQLF